MDRSIRQGASPRLRVAVVSTPFVAVPPVRYGGTELVVAELVRRLELRGHEVVLFATGDSQVDCTCRSLFATPVWPPEPLAELAHASWAADAIRRSARPFDVVHAHVATFLPFARTLDDVPVVYTMHHDRDERLSRFYAALPPGVQYVAISAMQAALHPELPRRVVVHHGLDPALYPFGPEGQGYLAFLGRFAEVKGPHTAIEVAGRLGRELRMGGRPHPDDAGFQDRVLRQLLDQDHVRPLGELGHGGKIRLLGGADALLFPIAWEEPFGLVMIEAMLCGCPVVAFRGGAVEEVVEPGLTGFVARDGDDMVRLVRDEVPRLDRRRVRARAIERFSSRRMADAYVDVYREAIAARGAQAAFPWKEVPCP
ncbi:glycosyltransferase family 4 protein [Vulgatibacter sp.]|uniref:glycosyltransferase family 4 protein n=1 Tax=Vulgatibacter sp. TaxID=1971226 RepID=UPI0035694AA4